MGPYVPENQFATLNDGLNVGLSIGGSINTYGGNSDVNFGDGVVRQDTAPVNIGGEVQTYGGNSNINLGSGDELNVGLSIGGGVKTYGKNSDVNFGNTKPGKPGKKNPTKVDNSKQLDEIN